MPNAQPPANPPLNIAEVNSLDREAFVARLGHVFEHSPWVVDATWPKRPWDNAASLHADLVATMLAAGAEQQLTLIRAHPDLVGRAARYGTLTRDSTAEQRAAGLDLDALSAAEIAAFEAANAAYQQRFGFPFIICARENRKESILAGFALRQHHDRRTEIATALQEIGKITWYRLRDLLAADEQPWEATSMGENFSLEVSYGKQGVAVYRVYATPLEEIPPIPESAFTGRHNNLLACQIDVEVFGDEFLPAYTHGDNSMIVATDSMKNFIIRESLSFKGATLEGLLQHLGTGFATTYEQLHSLRLSGRELPFSGTNVPNSAGGFGPSDNLFREDGGDRAHASISLQRGADGVAVTGHDCGIRDMSLMKLTGSAFTSFVRDDYTTLPDRRDRPLFVHLDVAWHYEDVADMLDLERHRYVPAEQMRDLINATFADFVSESIQHLIHEIGQRIFARFPQLADVSFNALNKTRDPYGQRQDDDRVRVYSDPFPAFGRLTLTMRRNA